MKYKTDKIKNALNKAFLAMELDQEKIDDAIFHLVDWLPNLKNWDTN